MKKLICLLGMTACIFAAHAQSADDESLFIVFSPNSAELQGVSPEQAIYNSKIFTIVAQLLLDNPKYRILIDGHANPVIKTSAEEKEQLKPLSEQRAEAAAKFLVEYFGVARYRLILTGAGGRFPSETQDPSLNRRVSFIVIAYQ
ncbi:MAG: OmpA family protein [Treponema sp.]|nr:OmpA family protein [Treponema sp.]